MLHQRRRGIALFRGEFTMDGERLEVATVPPFRTRFGHIQLDKLVEQVDVTKLTHCYDQ